MILDINWLEKLFCFSPTWYSSSSLESSTACSTLRCLSIIPIDSTTDFSWVITYSSPAQEKPYYCIALPDKCYGLLQYCLPKK